MGIFISCQGLSKAFGPRPLFEGLSFGLFEGERTGLIGPNGMGKSTLLKILAGQESADSGAVSARRGLRLAYLSQQDTFGEAPSGRSINDELTESLADLHAEPHELELRIAQGLADGGFPPGETPLNTLSGGWRKRLSILAAVLREPDLLLLDEPTNHLDLEGVLWLERFLLGLRFSFLVVTHDRRFLEKICNRIIELDKRYKDGHFSSAGSYSAFLERRAAYLSAQEATASALANIVRGEIEWLRKGPKARTTKQQARIDRAGGMIEDLAELEFRNAQTKAADIDFSGSGRRSQKLIEAKGISKSLGGRRLFGPLDLILGQGDKLGLVGANGSGKSTLMRILAGEAQADSGELKRAEGLKAAVFDQHRERLDLDMTLKRALCGNGEHVQFRGRAIHVAGWADRFLFRKEQLEHPLRRLSGGEQSRVLIARLMLRPVDLLMLDEPTNDLDLRSLEVLEASLQDFPGALVLVTHDRYLLDRVCRGVLALDGKGGHRFLADLSQWEAAEAEEAGASGTRGAAARAGGPKSNKRALSTKEWKELKAMEQSLQAAEEEAQAARLALEDPRVAADHAELARRSERVAAAQDRIEALYRRWEELESRAG